VPSRITVIGMSGRAICPPMTCAVGGKSGFWVTSRDYIDVMIKS
jgi:hypothetical protein